MSEGTLVVATVVFSENGRGHNRWVRAITPPRHVPPALPTPVARVETCRKSAERAGINPTSAPDPEKANHKSAASSISPRCDCRSN